MSLQLYLDKFASVSLDEMKNVKLMNRMDQKFVFHMNDLPFLLNEFV